MTKQLPVIEAKVDVEKGEDGEFASAVNTILHDTVIQNETIHSLNCQNFLNLSVLNYQ